MAAAMAENLRALLPGVDFRLIEEHLSRLDDRYFHRFEEREIAAHLEALATLSPANPVSVIVRQAASGEVECTVLAFDHAGVFSFIAGVLSSMGFDIHSGNIFTWGPPAAEAPIRDWRGLPQRELELRRRRIVDHFSGTIAQASWDDMWAARLDERLREVFGCLERGEENGNRARQIVNEMAARKIGEIKLSRGTILYPVQIEVDTSLPALTRMRVVSQDTPFFLFTFSTALSLQGVSIEHVTIRTESGRIEDIFEIVDAAGRKIEEPARIDGIKLSVLLTKQFTSFLENAPDPLAALLRFEQLVRRLIEMPREGRWLELLSDQNVLRDLAQLLGASTFLWEDFVRLQYEELLPMLAPGAAGRSLAEPLELLPERLELALAGAETEEEFTLRLNEFKDREVYLFDLDHILSGRRSVETRESADQARGGGAAQAFGTDFLTLSRRLTALAELVVDAASSFAYRSLVRRYGEPKTVAGLPVRFAIMGLGKMGGAALGYASDIELLYVYSDNGSTVGPEVAENSEFFDKLVREVLRMVHAKREGIFHIDLRLRPFGAAGPLACSLESYCTYYAPGGSAHSFERLSLVRLRTVGGDRALGSQIERLRDEMVYTARSVDLGELRKIREKQVQEKTRPGRLNAKFSPGALVDLEYAVQMLQVTHGTAEKKLRTPRIHEALDALASIGVLEPEEAEELVAAYRFFRHLINGLRMLRGSAQDLFLPSLDSDEYLHLARRMGYAPEPDATPVQRLHLDFETHSAAVRTFVERHFGRDSLPGSPAATVADIVLSDSIPLEVAQRTLSDRGFVDPVRAYVNLRHIAGGAERRTLFARLAILACDVLSHRPDPDMALNNWERFLHSLPDPQAHLRQMLSQPMRLEMLLSIFSASQFLADTLVRNPEFLDYIGSPEVLHVPRSGPEIAAELDRLSAECQDREQWRDRVRRIRRREILRIGVRDICLNVPTQHIMEEISDLADGIIAAALARARSALSAGGKRFGFSVIAFGKLGGRELNYSSDIDLLGLFEGGEDGDEAVEEATALMESLRADLSVHTTEGYAYRVDLRLRPYGSAGQLVFSRKSLEEYYSRSAATWEIQALLKARAVAGDSRLGGAFLDSVRVLLLAPREFPMVAASIDRLRKEALKSLARSLLSSTDIKAGLGGLRDIEFLAQGLQLANAHEKPELLRGGTLPALKALGHAGILPAETVEHLTVDYIFLRRVEHFLQIYEDRQTHGLPRDPAQQRALARLMLGGGATPEQLFARLAKRFERVQAEYKRYMGGA
jgi:glutamate-ammonia-ligase adenylyltransferase